MSQDATGGSGESAEPWRDDDGRPLSQLLELRPGPKSDPARCPWLLGKLDIGHGGLELAAWRVAKASMKHRCPDPTYLMWESAVVARIVLTPEQRRRLDPFLTSVYGTPEAPVPDDHLEGHVAEVLWFLITEELSGDGRELANAEGPSFSVTETGGDGLAIWRMEDGTLVFRLWEIKKHTSSAAISRTVSKACQQLTERSEAYLAKYAAVGSRQHANDLGVLYARLVDLWVNDDPTAGAAVSIATSRAKAPVRRCFGTLTSTFPTLADDGRLEGLVVAVGDFREFAAAVRRYVWSAHST